MHDGDVDVFLALVERHRTYMYNLALRLTGLLDAGYAIPVAFLLGLVALIMARRARENLRWFRLTEGGTGVASLAIIISAVTVCLAVTAALSIGFYELVLVYQRSR